MVHAVNLLFNHDFKENIVKDYNNGQRSSRNYFYVIQFDNLKRVFRHVEDMSGHLVDNIRNNFKISLELAK